MKIGIDLNSGQLFPLGKKKVDASWKGALKQFGKDWASSGKQFGQDWAKTGSEVSQSMLSGHGKKS